MPIYSILFFCVCFCISTVGAICGIGGGVIIKPVLDAVGIFSADTVNFLSGCTVLSMAVSSIFTKGKQAGRTAAGAGPILPLAAGAALGGVLGKLIFQTVSAGCPGHLVTAVQSACLLLVKAGTFSYTILETRLVTHAVRGRTAPVLHRGQYRDFVHLPFKLYPCGAVITSAPRRIVSGAPGSGSVF